MVDSKLVRLAIASDQAIYLRGLASLAMSMPGIQLVGEARSAEEAVQLCELSEPDILFLDLQSKEQSGVETAQRIMSRWSSVKVVLLLGNQEDQLTRDGTGQVGLYYLSRDVSEEEFRLALLEINQDPLEKDSVSGQASQVFRHQADEEEPEEVNLRGTVGFAQVPYPYRNNDITARELVMAGRIQADILPEVVPTIPGWDIAARLEPARETSGDFYDFIPLTERKWGIVVADVTDKGMGAALFMALSSTLIRTYAIRFPTLPALTLSAVSERILSDTRGSMFVTAFFGILEPHSGRLVFANAGHPPGYLITSRRGKESITPLRNTGMALGVSLQTHWRQKNMRMEPGDVLVLYTDGITEAQNPAGVFFEEDRLLDVVLSKTDCTAREILEALLGEVHHFVGNTPRQDDIALIIIRREGS